MIKIEFQEKRLRRWFDDLAEKQVPFATSVALNNTAFDARKALIAQFPRIFTVRSKWINKGLRVEKSHKTNLEAAIGHLDEYMARQAKGGTKTATKSFVGVPVRARKTPKHKTTRAKWPGRLLRKKKHFIKPLSAGGALGLFKIVGGKKNPRLELWYVLAERVKVPKRWPLQKTVEQVVREKFAANAAEAMRRALKTAKRK
jgi:hypothetical protein